MLDSKRMRIGLFRIWATLTGLAIIFVILTNYGPVADEFQRAAEGGAFFPPHPWWLLGGLLSFTLGIPLFILILGGGIFWVLEAFTEKHGQC